MHVDVYEYHMFLRNCKVVNTNTMKGGQSVQRIPIVCKSNVALRACHAIELVILVDIMVVYEYECKCVSVCACGVRACVY